MCMYMLHAMYVHVHAVAGDWPHFQEQDSLLEEPTSDDDNNNNAPTRPTYLDLPQSRHHHHHELSPMSNPRQSDPEFLNCEATAIVDRRNEFHSLQRFIFLSFGVPGAPALSQFAQRCSSKCVCVGIQCICIYMLLSTFFSLGNATIFSLLHAYL